jgi:hypothetical protein
VGRFGEELSEPLQVRVTSAAGEAVPGVKVKWTLLEGGARMGDFGQTDYFGLARTSFQPLTAGRLRVTASVDGLTGSPVEFVINSSGDGIVVIRFATIWDCYDTPQPNDSTWFDNPKGSFPVGTTVRWVYVPGMPDYCKGRIVPNGPLPAGAAPFDSGILHSGESFSLVLSAIGDWGFIDLIGGGTGVLRVRQP